MRPNQSQTALWNGSLAEHWIAECARYDTMHQHLTDLLLNAAHIRATDQILDVGCGSGSTTLASAELATNGCATGIDVSTALLAVARNRAQRTTTHFIEADAQTFPFPRASFDVAISKFGVAFFDDPEVAFANLAWSLKDGGRLAFICWRAPADNESAVVPAAALAPFLHPADDALAVATNKATPPGPFSLASADETERLLSNAGLGAITVEKADVPMHMGDTPDDVATYMLQQPQMKNAVCPVDLPEAKTALVNALAEYTTDSGVEFKAAVWLVTASVNSRRQNSSCSVQ